MNSINRSLSRMCSKNLLGTKLFLGDSANRSTTWFYFLLISKKWENIGCKLNCWFVIAEDQFTDSAYDKQVTRSRWVDQGIWCGGCRKTCYNLLILPQWKGGLGNGKYSIHVQKWMLGGARLLQSSQFNSSHWEVYKTIFMENINWHLNKIELMKENLHGFIKGKSFLIIPNEQFDEIL